MKSKREMIIKALEVTVIESLTSEDFYKEFYYNDYLVTVGHGKIHVTKYKNSKDKKEFKPWEIKEALDLFFEEDENYELEAKDDEEQSKLAEIMTEATREARVDVLEAIKSFCYSACGSTHNKTKKRAYHEVIDLIKSLGKVVDNQ